MKLLFTGSRAIASAPGPARWRTTIPGAYFKFTGSAEDTSSEARVAALSALVRDLARDIAGRVGGGR